MGICFYKGFPVSVERDHGEAFQYVQRMKAKARKAKAEPITTILSDGCMVTPFKLRVCF